MAAASARWHKNLSKGQHPMRALQYKDGEPALHPSQTSPFRWQTNCPPPLLDCGQGKINATTGTDGGEQGRDDWIQTRVSGNGEQWDEFRRDEEDLTANKDCIPASDASRPPTSVDLPRSETTPKPPSVAPPSGEHVTVNAVMRVNGMHSPTEQSSAGVRKRVA